MTFFCEPTMKLGASQGLQRAYRDRADCIQNELGLG